jgi:drug/metabolite transporter (DMT)-like permease
MSHADPRTLAVPASPVPPPAAAEAARRSALAATAATVVLWGTAFVAIRVALRGLSPGELSVARLVVAALALAAVAPLLGVRLPARSDLPRILACGATGMTAYQLLLNTGEVAVPAGTASLLIATAPVHALLLARLLLGEAATRRQWAGTLLAFAGVAVLAVSRGGAGGGPLPAAVAVLGAAVAQAAFFVLQKPLLARYSAVEVTCHAIWAGTLLVLPAGAGAIPASAAASVPVLAALLWLGVGASAVGFVTWARALARLPVSTAVASLNLVPLVAVGAGWLLLGEEPAPLVAVGGVLAVGGVMLVRTGARDRRS